MIDKKMRFFNSIMTIEYSNCYLDNFTLFNKGIEILKNRIKKNDFSEFKENEREILESIFEIMGNEI